MRFIALRALFCCCSAGAQQAVITVRGEPPNSDALKQRLKDYESCTESNCYVPQLERQAELASEFLKRSVTTAKPGERLALVLDIDETSLFNWAVETHDDFGFNQTDFNWCVTLRCVKAIAAKLGLFQQAEKDKVAVFFCYWPVRGASGGHGFESGGSLEGTDGDGVQVGKPRQDCSEGLSDCSQFGRPDERPERRASGRAFGQIAKSVLLHS